MELQKLAERWNYICGGFWYIDEHHMAEHEGVTEQLKAQDQMLWVQRMNNIRDRAMEIVNHDLIYA